MVSDLFVFDFLQVPSRLKFTNDLTHGKTQLNHCLFPGISGCHILNQRTELEMTQKTFVGYPYLKHQIKSNHKPTTLNWEGVEAYKISEKTRFSCIEKWCMPLSWGWGSFANVHIKWKKKLPLFSFISQFPANSNRSGDHRSWGWTYIYAAGCFWHQKN